MYLLLKLIASLNCTSSLAVNVNSINLEAAVASALEAIALATKNDDDNLLQTLVEDLKTEMKNIGTSSDFSVSNDKNSDSSTELNDF